MGYTVGERIKEEREKLGLTQQELCDLFDPPLKRSSISKWESGASNPDLDRLPAIARKLKTTISYLVSGKADKDELLHKGQPNSGLQVRYVPIKGSAKMGADGYFNCPESFASEVGDGYVPSYFGSKSAFALRGSGGSMYPAIRDGWLVVCEPENKPVPTEFVLVCFKDQRCIIKEFIAIQDDLLHLLSVNGNERMNIDMTEVQSIIPIIEIIPPSRRVLEIPVPVFEVE